MSEETRRAEAARDWLTGAALPLWLTHGLDRERGGFHEFLDPATLGCDAGFRRLRVAARQVYVFAAGMRLGHAASEAGLRHGLAFLRGPARHPEGGFGNRFDLDGRTLDATRDLYDLAFAGLALAHAFDVLRDGALRAEARALAGLIAGPMRHPRGGFLEALPPRAPRRQNPHMHLLEAALAWTELDPEGPWPALASEVLDRFDADLLDRERGILPEYFDDGLRPLVRGQAVEPGHQFEWVWLLSHAARLGLRGGDGTARRLHRWTHAHGIAPSGLPWGVLDPDGTPRPDPTRIWTATEWVKAEAVTRGPDRAARLGRAWAALSRFLDGPGRGLWHERWAGGAFLPGPVPATSLYHVTLAVETLCETAGRHPRPFAAASGP